KELNELGIKPEAPITNMILLGGDPTYEGLVRFFREGGALIAGLFTSEGGSFIGGHSMSDDARKRTTSNLSLLWDAEPLPRPRAGEGFFTLRGRRLAMHIQIQPRLAQLLFADPDLIDQGILSRVLAVAPASTAGKRPFVRTLDFSRISSFRSQVRGLLSKP